MSSQMPFNTNCMTLTRFLIAEQRKYKGTGEFSTLLNALQTAIKSVSSAVRKAGMTNLFGAANTVNVQGEDVKRLDVLSNELFINMLKSSYSTFMLVSEENEDVIRIDEDKAGKYLVAFDPLDGSSNIDCLASIGSIFAIYRQDPSTVSDNKPELVCGRNIVAAGYALYGSATMVVLAVSGQVNGFMLDPEIGEFILTDPNMKIPSRGKIYSVNEGYRAKWDQAMCNYVDAKKAGPKSYSSRYIGSMVADVHRTLKYGGIFMYPQMAGAPNGKLRLLYESNPMAFIFETADGLATTAPGKSILDIKPRTVHERCPVFLGSREDVEDIMREYTNLAQNRAS